MFPRPKPGESEEDLLRFQQEFLASKKSSSATLVKRPDKRKSEESKGSGDGKAWGNEVEGDRQTDRDVVEMEGKNLEM